VNCTQQLLSSNITSLKFHIRYAAIRKLPDSVGEAGFRLFPNPFMHRFYHFITATPATTKCHFKWTEGTKVVTGRGLECKVRVAELHTCGLELFLLLRELSWCKRIVVDSSPILLLRIACSNVADV
jgi:hypothetical protein